MDIVNYNSNIDKLKRYTNGRGGETSVIYRDIKTKQCVKKLKFDSFGFQKELATSILGCGFYLPWIDIFKTSNQEDVINFLNEGLTRSHMRDMDKT